MVDPHLKDYLPFQFKPAILIGIGGESFFFSYSITLLAFGALEPYPFIFLAFGTLSVRTSFCTILANGENSSALQLCMVVGQWGSGEGGKEGGGG